MPRARTTRHELTIEETLDPALPICDAHHHFFHGGTPPPHDRDRYLLEEYLLDAETGHNVVSSVFMECRAMYRADGAVEMRSLGETEFVNGIAAMSASGLYGRSRIAAGIVGHADLRLGRRIAPILEAHVAASRRFKGVRYATSYDAQAKQTRISQPGPPKLLLDPTFREGIACLQALGLSFDAWMVFRQLPELVDLARAMPNLQIVLGHVGGLVGIGPYSNRDEVFAEWARNVAEVAKCPNVCVKLGGIGIIRHGFGWHELDAPPTSDEMARAFAPYCLHCIEHFGVNRCMFESNFPVDGLSVSYHLVWNAFKRIASGFSPAERAALFHDTATRVYRLSESP